MGQNIEETVLEIAEPIVANKGLELVGVEYNKEGENWILRVFIDQDGGISLDDCEEVSQELSAKLDLIDPIDKSYLLEVSSPGLDRALNSDDDFIRFSGEKVDISTYAPVNGKKEWSGILLGLEEDKIKLEVEGEEVLIPRSKVAQTKLAVEF